MCALASCGSCSIAFSSFSRARRGGSPALSRAIEAQLELFERDLAVDLMRDPRIRTWATADVQLLAGMLVGLMAEALIPVMLLTLGIQLAAMGRPRIERHVAAVSAVRLLAGPLAAVLVAAVMGLSGIARDAGIIQASMPAAVLTSLIALEHDLLPDFVTTVVLFSTLASAVTLTLVLALV